VSTGGFSDYDSENEQRPLPAVYSQDDLPSFYGTDMVIREEYKRKVKSNCCGIF